MDEERFDDTELGASRETQILVVSAFLVLLLGYQAATRLLPFLYSRVSSRVAANTALDVVLQSGEHRNYDEPALEQQLLALSRHARSQDPGTAGTRRRNTKPSNICIVPAEQDARETKLPQNSSEPPCATEKAPRRCRFSLGSEEKRSVEPAEHQRSQDRTTELDAAATVVREALRTVSREASRPGSSMEQVDDNSRCRAEIIAVQDAEYMLSVESDLKKWTTTDKAANNDIHHECKQEMKTDVGPEPQGGAGVIGISFRFHRLQDSAEGVAHSCGAMTVPATAPAVVKPARVRRRFKLSATVGDVLEFIKSCEECPPRYKAYVPFPKRELNMMSQLQSLSEWGITSNCVIDVEPES